MKSKLSKIFPAIFAAIFLFACSGTIPHVNKSDHSFAQTVSQSTVQRDYWPTDGWKTSTPEEQGMDSELLLKMFKAIVDQNVDIHSVLIVRHGYLVTEAYFNPYDEEYFHHIYSCTKSFTSTLIGIAKGEGLINSLEQRVLDFFPEYQLTNLDDRKKSMTLKNLLTMTSGLEWKERTYEITDTIFTMAKSNDWVGFVLNQPMVGNPGDTFNYNSGVSHLLSAIIKKTTGYNLSGYAKKKIFKPIGISDFWLSNSQNITIGGWGLYLTPRDMAKFGFLFLNHGVWEDKQIVPADWVDEATKKQVDFNDSSGYGYGYQWWLLGGLGLTHKNFAALGRFGQTICIMPDLDLVAVFTAGEKHGRTRIPSYINDYLAPAVKSSASLKPNPEMNKSLQSLIVSLKHPAAKTDIQLPDTADRISGKTFVMDNNSNSFLKSATFTFNRKDECRIKMEYSQETLNLLVGLDDVYRTEKYGKIFRKRRISAKGFWQDDRTFSLSVYSSEGFQDLYAITFNEDHTVSCQIETMYFKGTISGKMAT